MTAIRLLLIDLSQNLLGRHHHYVSNALVSIIRLKHLVVLAKFLALFALGRLMLILFHYLEIGGLGRVPLHLLGK